ncbi:MAG: hypothetical protein QXJ93_01575, partial [Candidatus Rehaiarchaeum fermentans]|nr:hypothetical protein [Candidatus Rehaiarchaeum fermentans]
TKFGKFVFPMLVKPLTSALETVIYKAYYDKSKITNEMKNDYKKALKVRDWDKGLYYLSTSPNNVDIEPLTKDFNIPTLVIFGSNVEIVSKYSVVNFSSKPKNVKIVEISECGHIPHEEKGNDFINSLIALRSLNLFFYAL